MAKKPALTEPKSELVIITGLSGSGKGSVLKVLEDLGYYSVDNLPVDLIPKFAELTQEAETVRRSALVVDIREGEGLKKFPAIFRKVQQGPAGAPDLSGSGRRGDHAALQRDAAPASAWATRTVIASSIEAERKYLAPIRALGGSDDQHLQVHGPRTAGLHQ